VTKKLVVLLSVAAAAAEIPETVWPQHRGPGGRGIAGSPAPLPVGFRAKEGYVWKTALPAGKSSPILASGKLFVTAHEGKKLLTICIDAKTGAELWRREVEQAREEQRNRLNDPASPTPVTDGRAVYSFFADSGLVAYNLKGDELWRTPLGPFESEHGMATWPAVGSDSLFVVADVSNGAFLAAFDKKTGKQRWRVNRRSTVGAYASPVVHQPKNGPEVVITSGPFEMAAYDAATGEKVWWVTGLPFQPKSAPVAAGDTVYMNSLGIALPWPDFASLLAQYDKDGNGTLSAQESEKFGYVRFNFTRLDENKNGELEKAEWDPIVRGDNATLAVRITGKGDQTANILWRYRKSLPDVPQPLVHEGVLYNVRDGGILTALDAATGRVLKQGRLRGAIDQYFASPVAGDGKVYVSSAAGTLTVIRAGGDWEVLSTNDMDEPLWATPAVDGSNMYIRAGNSLYCFRGDAKQTNRATPSTKDLSVYTRFTGAYQLRPGNEVSVTIEDGMLLMKRFNTEAELVRTGDLTFRTKQPTPMLLTFAGDGGQITSVTLEANGRTLVFLRVP
jgi:outer membrane protein assembly factor BamB